MPLALPHLADDHARRRAPVLLERFDLEPRAGEPRRHFLGRRVEPWHERAQPVVRSLHFLVPLVGLGAGGLGAGALGAGDFDSVFFASVFDAPFLSSFFSSLPESSSSTSLSSFFSSGFWNFSTLAVPQSAAKLVITYT